jgi:hypothetical protein
LLQKLENNKNVGVCKRCISGTYSILDPMENNNINDIICKECNSNARCLGGNIILPKFGYMRILLDDDEILSC